MQAFTAGYVDNVAVGGSDGDGSNGLRGLFVENRIPGAAVIIAFPHPAVYLADVKDIRLLNHAGCGAGASAAKGTDETPVQIGHGWICSRRIRHSRGRFLRSSSSRNEEAEK